MVSRKVDEDGLNYLIWAKKNKYKHDDILAELANHDIEVSSTRISQLYQKNHADKSKGVFNPYDPESQSKLTPVSTPQYDTEIVDDSPPESIHTEIPTFETENGGSYMIDLKPILTASGIRGVKNAQVIKVFERTNGTPRDLQESLEVLGVGLSNQKQVIAQAYGMDIMKEIFGRSSKVKNQSSTVSNPNPANAQQMMNGIIAQKVASISNRIALKDAEATLIDLEGKTKMEGEDITKTVKELLALKALGSDNDSGNKDLINKLIIEKVKSEDNQLLKAIELMEKLRGSGSKEEDIKLKYLMDETKQLRESAEKSKEQYLKAETEKMHLILEHIQKEAARTAMSFEDYTNQIGHSVQIAERMGMTQGGKSDQQDAIQRLNAGTQLAETFSTKLDTGIDKLGQRIEGGINILVELLERRDQRMDAKLTNQNNTGLRDLPPREEVSMEERDQALNNIGGTLQNAERLRDIHNRFRKISG